MTIARQTRKDTGLIIKILSIIRLGLILGAILVLSGASASSARAQVSGLVIFGDSLVDTGNLSSLTGDFPFPYYENRISDGPLAVDYVASGLGMQANPSQFGGNNYALSGANILGESVTDLQKQVDRFLGDRGGFASPNSLYFLMIGSNDLRGLRRQTNQAAASSEIDQAISKLILEMNRLRAAGARHFYVTNSPNVARTPEVRLLVPSDANVVNRLGGYVSLYNQRLKIALGNFARSTGVNLLEHDLRASFDRVLDNAASFGITNTTDACFRPDDQSFNPACIGFPQPKFNQFVFFDNLHPTGRTHQLVGQPMSNQLNDWIATGFGVPTPNIFGAIMLLLGDD